jgi:hypothetical protein
LEYGREVGEHGKGCIKWKRNGWSEQMEVGGNTAELSIAQEIVVPHHHASQKAMLNMENVFRMFIPQPASVCSGHSFLLFWLFMYKPPSSRTYASHHVRVTHALYPAHVCAANPSIHLSTHPLIKQISLKSNTPPPMPFLISRNMRL